MERTGRTDETKGGTAAGGLILGADHGAGAFDGEKDAVVRWTEAMHYRPLQRPDYLEARREVG